MGYKTILIHLDRGARRNERLELGFALGQAFDAHVVGLYAIAAPRIPSHALAEAGPTVTQIEARRRAEDMRDAEAVFRAAAGRHGGAKAEWRASGHDALGALRLHARYADLVVIGQPQDGDEDSAGVPPGLAGDLVLSAGRPVLLVPYTGRFASAGKRALVAWNASREAARAVSDALPLLRRAEAVRVVSFHPERDDHGAEPGADIGLALARHGVKVEVARQPGGDVDAGEEILSRAADFGADLVVMGGYGHARLRELVLGGATRTLLESMTMPVLMSH